MTEIVRSKERVKETGECFTPPELVNEVLDKLPSAVWTDPSKTWLDPAAGDGNFLVEVRRRLLEAGGDEVHVLEHQLFAAELMRDNVERLQKRLGYITDEGLPNPKLDPAHFRTDIAPDGEPYLHHWNVQCVDSLQYDFSFGRDDTSLEGFFDGI